MKVVTAGEIVDIDVLACSIAYAELLNLCGQDAVAVITDRFGETVTKSIRKMDLEYKTSLPDNVSEFILVDVSSPQHFASFVDHSKITEVWDHRWGFEDHWKDQPVRDELHIVGACATLIYEEFVRLGKLDQISPVSANLLYTTTFSNTLNFQSPITHQRDHDAFNGLKPYIDLPENWIEIYYQESQESILSDPVNALKNDTKIVEVQGKTTAIGQLEPWDAEALLSDQNLSDIQSYMSTVSDQWMVNIPNISKGCVFVIASDSKIQGFLEENFPVSFHNFIGKIEKIMPLRKEIMRKIVS